MESTSPTSDPEQAPAVHAGAWPRPTRQARSLRTRQRILAAALELAQDEQLAGASMAEIADRAGVSVGGFYARFRNRAALLHALHEHFLQTISVRMLAAMREVDHPDASCADIVRRYVDTMVMVFHEHRALLRQVVERVREGEGGEFRERLDRFNREMHGLVVAPLLRRADQITHPDPAAAIAFGVRMVSAAARHELVLATDAQDTDPTTTREELVRAYLAYLGLPATP